MKITEYTVHCKYCKLIQKLHEAKKKQDINTVFEILQISYPTLVESEIRDDKV